MSLERLLCQQARRPSRERSALIGGRRPRFARKQTWKYVSVALSLLRLLSLFEHPFGQRVGHLTRTYDEAGEVHIWEGGLSRRGQYGRRCR